MGSVLVGWLVSAVLNWLERFFANHLAAYERDKSERAAAVAQAAQDNEKASHINEQSKSDDIDAAIDDSFKHL